jgi:hypothetical protein
MALVFTKKEEREQRVKTCDTCELRENTKCSVCGCSLMFLQKVKWAKCPDNKWNPS